MLGPRDILPLPEGCPWSGWALPDLKHCEANLCAWVTAPANTWSNLAYFAAAAWILSRPAGARAIGWACVITGAGSFLFHASFTAAFQFLDYVAMFVLLAVFLGFNLRRLGLVAPERLWTWMAALIAACAAAFGALRLAGLPVQPIILVLTAAALAAEAAVWRRGGDRRPWAAGVLLMAAAATAWVLDYSRLWCDPNDHVLQGHAAWHLLTAAAFVVLHRFYAQFPELAGA